MTFFAIFLALLLEQARPLVQDNLVYATVRAWARWVRQTLDAGQTHHGWLAWALAAVVPALASAALYGLFQYLSGWLAFAWTVLLLYLTLGFRHFSHHFTAIREALESGDEVRARTILGEWQSMPAGDLPRPELLRRVIEHAVIAAHRHVFGVLVCFVVFALLGLGPAGAVLYRVAEYLSRSWRAQPHHGPNSATQQVAHRAWCTVDYVPVRVTAVGFAVVGNFEEALASWRQDTRQGPCSNDSVLLAATAGAVNVRLGGAESTPEAGAAGWAPGTEGRTPQLAHMASVVGLVWRSVVLWLLLLAMGGLARLM
jgi:adenosylcobinamide-phosphate synthase